MSEATSEATNVETPQETVAQANGHSNGEASSKEDVAKANDPPDGEAKQQEDVAKTDGRPEDRAGASGPVRRRRGNKKDPPDGEPPRQEDAAKAADPEGDAPRQEEVAQASAPSSEAPRQETAATPPDGLRLRMKVWTDRETSKRYLVPTAMFRDIMKGVPISDRMYAYAMRDDDTKMIALTAAEWNVLPFHYFKEDGAAPRASARPPDVAPSP